MKNAPVGQLLTSLILILVLVFAFCGVLFFPPSGSDFIFIIRVILLSILVFAALSYHFKKFDVTRQTIITEYQAREATLTARIQTLQTVNAEFQRDNHTVTVERDTFQADLQESQALSNQRQTEYENLQALYNAITVDRDQQREMKEQYLANYNAAQNRINNLFTTFDQ